MAPCKLFGEAEYLLDCSAAVQTARCPTSSDPLNRVGRQSGPATDACHSLDWRRPCPQASSPTPMQVRSERSELMRFHLPVKFGGMTATNGHEPREAKSGRTPAPRPTYPRRRTYAASCISRMPAALV